MAPRSALGCLAYGLVVILAVWVLLFLTDSPGLEYFARAWPILRDFVASILQSMLARDQSSEPYQLERVYFYWLNRDHQAILREKRSAEVCGLRSIERILPWSSMSSMSNWRTSCAG